MNLLSLFPWRIVHIDTIDGLKADAVANSEMATKWRRKYEAANAACKALIAAGVKRPRKSRRPVKRPSSAARAARESGK